MKKRLFPLLFVFLYSCSSEMDSSKEMEEQPVPFIFSDGFETTTDNFFNLFPDDGSRWSGTQIVSPNSGENSLMLSTEQVREGQQSLVIESKQSDEILSKVDIEKGGFIAQENSTVIIETDFYIDSDTNLENLFLIDLECCSCWDPNVPDNQCPGIRLSMSGGNDYLSIERGKIAGTTLSQSELQFPRKEWVNVRWQMQLSSLDNGINELFINDQKVLSESAMNLPNAELFKTLFAENDIDFELQQPIAYERVQIGVTANPNAEDLTIYVDNFSISVLTN